MRDVFLSGPAGVGKDTVASVLASKYEFARMAFADPMKDLIMRINPQISTDRLAERVAALGWDEAKTHPEVRRLLQETGMACRDLFGAEFWIRQLALRMAYTPLPVVVTDMRMENEFDFAVDDGAVVVRLSRPGVDTGVGWRSHASERDLDAISDDEFDLVISGDWSPESAAASIVRFIELEDTGD